MNAAVPPPPFSFKFFNAFKLLCSHYYTHNLHHVSSRFRGRQLQGGGHIKDDCGTAGAAGRRAGHCCAGGCDWCVRALLLALGQVTRRSQQHPSHTARAAAPAASSPAPPADVLVAPSALYVAASAAAAPAGVAVALQDVHTAKGLGAFTGSHTVDQVVGASPR